MPLSTNSIIHYTDSYEKLESILKEGFAIKYCSEKLLLNPRVTSFAAHPMVSFCDVPLSQAYNHFDAYGNYGIGLSKTWANKMKINPVIYIDKNSLFGEVIGEFIIERRKTKSNLTVKQKQNILRIKCYAKNYSGYLKRKGIDDKNYRFYDEREWRLVPKEKDLNGLDRADLVVGQHHGHEDGPVVQRCVQLVGINPAVAVDRDLDDLEAELLEVAHRVAHRVVLDGARDQAVSARLARPRGPLDREVVGLG